MSDWFSRITGSLRDHGHRFLTWRAGDGQLLVTPHAARVLACRMDNVEGNLFWHNLDIEKTEFAGDPINSAGGGLGGDRLWIGPEIGFNWPDLAHARVSPWDQYKVPPQMDPAQWHVTEESDRHLRLTCEMELHDYRLDQSITLRVSRQFDVVDRPGNLPAGVSCTSFGVRNDLTMLECGEGVGAGAWDILQLPAGGSLVCATTGPVARPRQYYGQFDPDYITTDDRSVRFKIDGRKQLKIGLNATQSLGRMGYYRVAGNVSTLIFRAFQSLPGETYVDLPLTSNDYTGGDTLQAYNDGGQFGGFGEMEYHDPALRSGDPRATRSGSNITHVLAGPDAAIREAGRQLLGVTL